MSNKTKILQNNSGDYTASTLKGVLGAVPVVGAALAEIVGSVIPNQRIDRLADFAERLSNQVQEHQRILVQQRLLNPEGIDIVEEALWQSARALTDERRQRIAALVKNGLTKTEMNLLETKKLLLILNQLNDIEVVLLRSFADVFRHDAEMYEKFGDALDPVPVHFGSTREELDKNAIAQGMRQHLVQLGLSKPQFSFVKRGQLPEFDSHSGEFKNSGHNITPLGKLLLRAIDFHPPENTET